MDRCYFAKEPPEVEVRGGLVFITPEGGHCEIAVTPAVLRRFVMSAGKALADFEAAKAEPIPLRAAGRH